MLLGAVEAGGTKFVCAVGNEFGEVIKKVRIDTTNPEETLGKVFEFFKSYDVKAVGLGCFGPLDLNEASKTFGYITTTPKKAWRNYNILEAFKRELHIPVLLDTDVNASCIGEATYGSGKGIKNCLYLTVGTGIGGGALVNGELLHGLLHPEMGHILVRKHKEDSYEGKCPWHHSCLEGLASGPALKERLGGKGAEELEEDSPLWDYVAYYLAQALMNYVLILSPEIIILGGGVMHNEHLLKKTRESFKELLAEYVIHRNFKEDIEKYIISPALGDDAGIVGALALGKLALEK